MCRPMEGGEGSPVRMKRSCSLIGPSPRSPLRRRCLRRLPGRNPPPLNRSSRTITRITCKGCNISWRGEGHCREGHKTIKEEEKMLRNLEKRETEYMRLQRRKMGIDDFELLTVIGKGAFGENKSQIKNTEEKDDSFILEFDSYDNLEKSIISPCGGDDVRIC